MPIYRSINVCPGGQETAEILKKIHILKSIAINVNCGGWGCSFRWDMSVARIHDKHKLKSFWEQRIQQHTLLEGVEQSRERESALIRLREDWLRRLTQRNQNQQSFFEERIRRARKAQWLPTNLP
ncbi:unnamed protein product [Merluccius merluccius]